MLDDERRLAHAWLKVSSPTCTTAGLIKRTRAPEFAIVPFTSATIKWIPNSRSKKIGKNGGPWWHHKVMLWARIADKDRLFKDTDYGENTLERTRLLCRGSFAAMTCRWHPHGQVVHKSLFSLSNVVPTRMCSQATCRKTSQDYDCPT